MNPYIYPASVSQVFFMEDPHHPEWKVVIRHEPRTRRVIGDREDIDFGARGTDTDYGVNDDRSYPADDEQSELGNAIEVPIEVYNNLAAQVEDAYDDRHLDDTQYEDEVEILYVE